MTKRPTDREIEIARAKAEQVGNRARPMPPGVRGDNLRREVAWAKLDAAATDFLDRHKTQRRKKWTRKPAKS